MHSKKGLTEEQIILLVIAAIFAVAVIYWLVFVWGPGIGGYTKQYILPFGR